jgi:iron complex outermembrane recepter protein
MSMEATARIRTRHRKTVANRSILAPTALAAGMALAFPAFAQEASTQSPATTPKTPATLDTIQVIGSRARGRTAEETPAPVDVISNEELTNTGAQEVGQLLQLLEPSFNFSRTTVSDGTDILRPATLRSLGPDQVLVLVNGKRRHQQALVNVQETVGRGSAGTDINAIPLSAIDRIEVLRDGAAAQYGSDAIAGVINIVLKQQTGHTDVSLMAGENYEGDGRVLSGSVNTGFKLGAEGFLNLSAEYRDRGETNRAGVATTNLLGWYDQAQFDAGRRDVKLHVGDADATDAYLWLNGEIPMGGGELYWFGGLSRREGSSFGFYRGPHDNRTVPNYYPDGFLPNIVTTVEDASLAVGYRARLGDNWDWDFSVNHGRNDFSFHESNTVNVSWFYEPAPGGGIYGASPTEADTGKLKFRQTTANLDFRGLLNPAADHPVNLATGLEWRRDSYAMEAGDPVSWSYGRTNNRSVVINGQAGTLAPPGTQGFPGFQPSNVVDRNRTSWAAYVDAEVNFTDRLLLGGAVRYEDYSDFGNTTNGKLSARWDINDVFAVRGTLSTGFRAPGMQQANYSYVQTTISGGTLTDVLVARNDSPVTLALGIPSLKEETSINKSFGFVFKPIENFSLTADVFRIDIDDRIVYSSTISVEPAASCDATLSNCPIRRAVGPDATGVQFFTNAVDTSTTGIDIVARANRDFASGTKFDFMAMFNFNKTEVKDVHSGSAVIPEASLFSRGQEVRIERGQPREHHVLQGIWTRGNLDLTLRENYFGEVEAAEYGPFHADGKWLTDLAVGYRFSDRIKLTVGGNNIFDVYPTKWDPDAGFPFPQLGFTYGWETNPFGFGGGSYYARLDFRF